MDLPPEIRVVVYHFLIVDAVRDKDRIELTLGENGKSSWNHIAERLPPDDDDRTTDIPPPPLESSVSHINYSNLLSLATSNKTLYREATPIIYGNADLEYTSGVSPTESGSTLLHIFLNNFTPANFALFDELTVIDGSKELSARDVKAIVDLANSKLPNLKIINIQSIDPVFETWVDGEPPSCAGDFAQLMTASRPVACLTSTPILSVKPRLLFYFEYDMISPDPGTRLIMTVMKYLALNVMPSFTAIRNWRHESQIYHARACQNGDYLQLTYALRSVSDVEWNILEEWEDMSIALSEHQEDLSQIQCYKTWQKGINGLAESI